jgi:7,8-dihydro-6-hydroxymethylpterin-pyrophosphokinase
VLGSDLVSLDPELMLPHPRAHERAFVLAPWAGVDARAVLRVDEALVPVSDLLERAEDTDRQGAAEPAAVRPGPDWSPSW